MIMLDSLVSSVNFKDSRRDLKWENQQRKKAAKSKIDSPEEIKIRYRLLLFRGTIKAL